MDIIKYDKNDKTEQVDDRNTEGAIIDNFSNTSPSRLKIILPGFIHSKERENQMEKAIVDAVLVMKGDKKIIDFMSNEPNLDNLVKRFRKNNNIDDKEDFFNKFVEFIKSGGLETSIRNLCDYVLASAHYRYMVSTTEYQPIKSQFGTVTVSCPYGIPRDIDNTTMDTPFSGAYQINPYAGYADRARNCLKKYCDKDGYMIGKIGEEKIQLNKTFDSSRRPANIRIFDKVRNHIEDIYQGLLKNKNTYTQEKKIQTVAEIHRRFAQIMPYGRGSAAIGDMLSKALFDYLGVKVSPYKEGISPDLEAYVYDLKNFKKNYHTFFSIAK